MSVKRTGFTLVELMIVVAIIGILAAIAVPNFVDMQYRSKRAEVPTNVDGIKTAEVAYDAAYDVWAEQATFWPDPSPGKQTRAWTGGSGFETMGWTPDGVVRGSYKVIATTAGDFMVTGICDVDGNLDRATYTATRDSRPILNHPNELVY